MATHELGTHAQPSKVNTKQTICTLSSTVKHRKRRLSAQGILKTKHKALLHNLALPSHNNLKHFPRQLLHIPSHFPHRLLYPLHHLLTQHPFPRIKVHTRRRKQCFRKVRNHPTIARTCLLPPAQYFPFRRRNHKPAFSAPGVRHARQPFGIFLLAFRRGIVHVEWLVQAMYALRLGGADGLVCDHVVDLRREGVGHGRVGYYDVLVLVPHWERRVGDVPGAGEPLECGWGDCGG